MIRSSPLGGARSRWPSSPTLGIAAACLLVIALLWVATLERIRHEERQVSDQALERAAGMAMGLEEQTARTLRGIDQLLSFVEYEYRRQGAKLDLQELLAESRWDQAVFVNIAVVDEHGRRRLGRLPAPVTDVSDREYFTWHRDGQGTGLFVGKPTIGRTSGMRVVHFSRRLSRADGGFAGVVHAAVTPEYFARFYERADFGARGLVTLVSTDGTALVRRVGSAITYGDDMRPSTLMRKAAVEPQGTFLSVGRLDATPRFYAYRKVAQYPLIAAVGLPRDDVVASFDERRRGYLALALLGSLVAALAAGGLIAAQSRQRRMLERLAQTETRYREIFEGVVEGIYRTTPEGRFLVANPAMARILGYDSVVQLMTERTDIAAQGFFMPERRDEFRRLVERDGGVTGFEYEALRRDGTRVWVKESARAIRDEAGRVECYEGTLEDIDARKRHEERLREADRRAIEGYEALMQRLADLAETLAHATTSIDIFRALRAFVAVSAPCNGLIVSSYEASTASRRCLYLWSEGREEDVEQLPSMPLGNGPQGRAILSGEVVVTGDFQEAIRGLSGTVKLGSDVDPRLPQSSLVVPVTILGRAIGAIEIQSVERAAYGAEHVTALRMAAPLAGMAMENARLLEDERRLRQQAEESERRKAAILESAQDAVVTADAHDLMVEFNPAAERMFGRARAEVIGRPVAELLVPPELRDRHRGDLRSLAEGHGGRYASRRFEISAMRADGSRFPVEISVRRMGTHTEPLFTAFIRDLTERKRAEADRESLEAQLRESQKMEAIGRLAGGVAHDFNNILGAILGNLELARQDASGNPRVLLSLDEIRKAGHRARDLVQQILSFSRRQPSERKPLSLCEVAQESVRLLRATLPARVEVRLHCEPGTPPILGDATQMGQVLLNLCNNSVYAMGDKPGRIDIRVEPAVAGYVRIVVADTGHGMDAGTRSRIFEPFFTTKPMGEGTGLGLPVVHGIVMGHGGAIDVQSEPGKGCTFRLTFPAAHATAAAPAAVAPAAMPAAGKGEAILYVDDDDALVFLVDRMLTRRGYKVQAFSRQDQALDALRDHPGAFQLLVTDYNMPGLSGLDVARAARQINPALPVAMASGYITDELREQAQEAGVRELVFKPNLVEEFCDAVQRLLAPREQASEA